MSGVHNSVDTVNAAATAIVAAETRTQPSSVQKRRRWGGCWSLYWCFGSYKQNKRIGHAVLVSEPITQRSITPVVENPNQTATIILPFIAPPSSPAYFLQSDPSSATHSPPGSLSLASLSVHAHSPNRTPSIYTIGPYANETQLVSPPVFSAFTTEPSTASFTPPPEPVQMTTPSSPEVPFAQLVTSSLARSRRNSGKYSFSPYEFQPYQYPGSPGGHSKSPGSAFSTSGTSSPYKPPIIEFRMGEAPKYIGYEHFSNYYKWGSRVGSGSLTPNSWGSRLGSGTLTPNGRVSRLGSGTLTPSGGEPPSGDGNLPGNQISEVASFAYSDHDSQTNDVLVDHRVSFELFGEDIPTSTIRESAPSHKIGTHEAIEEGTNLNCLMMTTNAASFRIDNNGENENLVSGIGLDEKQEEFYQKQRTISLGSSKDFNFDNSKGEVLDKSTIDCEWWISDKIVGNELGTQKKWTFFPMLQSGVS